MAVTCALNCCSSKSSLLMPVKKLSSITASWGRHACRIGREDPRRVIHALKAGTALTLVALLYILEPLFKGIGKNAMWAVMTVVVVFEFTAGATICKGLNRALGTVMAGSLAFLIEIVAVRSGRVFRAFFVGFSVFLQSDNGVKLPPRGCAAFSARSLKYYCHGVCNMPIHESLGIPKLVWRRPPQFQNETLQLVWTSTSENKIRMVTFLISRKQELPFKSVID